jgi:triosephosphate isomerase
VTLYIGTSWKMNKTIAEARAFVSELNAVPRWPENVQPFILPAHTALSAVRCELDPRTGVWVGAQNAHWKPNGAVTGEVSMSMVKDAGASLVEIGHSERRACLNETDHSVNLKIIAALDSDLIPILCVGEGLEVRRRGGALAFVMDQVDAALTGIPAAACRRILIAYEPIWSIGDAGIPASPKAVAEIVSAIRGSRDVLGVLYGGSVNHENAKELLAIVSIDGLFVGRSAWTAQGFLRLVSLAAGTLR